MAKNTTEETIVTNTREAKEALRVCFEVNLANPDEGIVPYLEGPPGIGKTAIIRALAKEVGYKCKTFVAAQCDPVDVRGLPRFTDEGGVTWALPEIFRDVKNTIILFDELSNAPKLVLNSIQQVIREKQVGEHALDPSVFIVGAGNRASDKAGSGDLTTSIASRVLRFSIVVDHGDWCSWAIDSDIHPMVLAFVRFRPGLLHDFDRSMSQFPCPRTWEHVSKLIHHGLPPALDLKFYTGAIGHGAAIEFKAFADIYAQMAKISIDAILLDPKKAKVPGEVSALYAVASALGHRAKQENFERVITYLERLPVEFNVMAVRDAITRDGNLTSEPAFVQWSVNHADVIL